MNAENTHRIPPETVALAADSYGHWYIADSPPGGRHIAYYQLAPGLDELQKMDDERRAEYRNIWCILRSLDQHEVEAQFDSVPDSDRRNLVDWDWPKFRNDPHAFYIKANDTLSAAIWRGVKERMVGEIKSRDISSLLDNLRYQAALGPPNNWHFVLLAEAAAEITRLNVFLNTPMFVIFADAVKTEAAHQIERWGTPHDRAKEPQDWFWLIGYLAGKALRAHLDMVQAKNDNLPTFEHRKKALHHTISSAAALLNWHSYISGHDSGFTPGASDLHSHLIGKFGEGMAGDE